MSLTNAKHSVAVLSVALLISLAGALLIFVQRSPRVVTSADGYIVKLEEQPKRNQMLVGFLGDVGPDLAPCRRLVCVGPGRWLRLRLAEPRRPQRGRRGGQEFQKVAPVDRSHDHDLLRIMRNLNLPGPKFAYICPADANPRFRGEPLLSAAFSIQFPEQAEVNDNFPVMVSGDRDQEFYAGHALLLSSAKGRPITLHGLFSAEAFPRLAVSQSRFVNFLSKPEQLREDSTPQQN